MNVFNAYIVPKICNAILHSYRKLWPRDLIHMHLASPLDYHAQTMNWDCGYRNIQTLISSYLNSDFETKDQLFSLGINTVPTLRTLQNKIENGWKKGFDKVGGMQLDYFLVNTSKWIGATEVVAMLRFFKIRACIGDFDFTSNLCDLNTMFLIISEYFQNRSDINYFKNKKKFFMGPLYFQHQGHSRLIIGVEKWMNGDIRLVILDPQVRRFSYSCFNYGDEIHVLKQGVGSYEVNSKSKYQIAYLAKKNLYYNKKEYVKIIVDELRHPKLHVL